MPLHREIGKERVCLLGKVRLLHCCMLCLVPAMVMNYCIWAVGAVHCCMLDLVPVIAYITAVGYGLECG